MKKKILKDIIFTGKILYKEGLVNSHAGNISVRYNDSIFITRTGSMLGYLTDKDIIEVPLNTTSSKDKKASSELLVHRKIYQNTDAKAIVHAHPVNAVALSFILNTDLIPIDIEGKLFLKKIPIIEVEKASGSLEPAETLSKKMKENEVVLIKKHGSFVKSHSLNYALKLTSDLEFCAKIYILVKNILEKNKHEYSF